MIITILFFLDSTNHHAIFWRVGQLIRVDLTKFAFLLKNRHVTNSLY